MSTARRSPPAAKRKAAPRKLPTALAERAQAQRDARVAERARAAVARVRECQVDVAANTVDIAPLGFARRWRRVSARRDPRGGGS